MDPGRHQDEPATATAAGVESDSPVCEETSLLEMDIGEERLLAEASEAWAQRGRHDACRSDYRRQLLGRRVSRMMSKHLPQLAVGSDPASCLSALLLLLQPFLLTQM